jgi:hypothetical protein
MDKDELIRKMGSASALVKLICGVGNNAAWLVMLDGYDHARQCQRFKGKVKQGFNSCISMFHEYERNLVHARVNRFFHVADMTPDIRKRYGDITDRDYYDMWAGLGGAAYQRTKPLLNSLWNKYRLSLDNHGVKDATHVAWLLVTASCLDLAVQLYHRATNQCIHQIGIPRKITELVFKQFSLAQIDKRWTESMTAIAPDTVGYELDKVERRNIEWGLDDLLDQWMNPDFLYSSTFATIEDYGEMFRTKGEHKKALREIADIQNETNKNLKEDSK